MSKLTYKSTLGLSYNDPIQKLANWSYTDPKSAWRLPQVGDNNDGGERENMKIPRCESETIMV